MFRLANSLMHDSESARDIVHDVFTALLDADASFVVGEGYLLRSVRNRCINAIRDCGIHRRVVNLYFAHNYEYAGDEWPDEETLQKIDMIIRSEITPQARRMIQLRFSDRLPFAQVAEAMGISQTAVFRHLSHALIIIRQKLHEND